MNPNTGEIRLFSHAELERQREFKPLPVSLLKAAKLKLQGKDSAFINTNSNTPLSKWARKKRKNKAARIARRNNRK